MTRARNIAGFSTITTTPSPVHVGPIGVLTATRIDGEFGVVDIQARTIEAVSIAATNFQVSGITTGLNVSGIITAQNGINFNGTSTGLNVSGVGTIATLNVTGNATIAGVLTYEDVTNVDSVGVVTARGLSIFGNTTGLQVASGISTFQAVTGTTGTFSGAVSGTTGTFSGDITANGNIVGDNSTNISGISSVTATGLFGALTGNVTGDVTGNADTATVASNVTVADESSDTTCHPLFSTTNTGNAAVKVGSNLSFNSSSGALSATSFVGDGSALTGLVADKIFEGNTEAEVVDTGSDGHFKVTTEGSERLRITSTGLIDASSNTTAIALPQGTTAQRPSGSAPYIRKNTTNNALEYFDGTSWVEIITDYFPTGSTILG